MPYKDPKVRSQKSAERARKWRRANPELNRARQRKYHETYYAKHGEQIRARSRANWRKNSSKRRASRERYLATENGAKVQYKLPVSASRDMLYAKSLLHQLRQEIHGEHSRAKRRTK